MRIELLRDYRGIKINDELWLKGVREVEDDLGNYLIGKGYARASNEPLPEPPVIPAAAAAIAIHNQAVDDLELPSHLKVQPTTERPPADEFANLLPDYNLLSRDELLTLVQGFGIEVEGTGKDGHITKQNLVAALEAGED